jgi:isochorismate synthase
LTNLSFFGEIEKHLNSKLPFIVFRHPNETRLTAFLDHNESPKPKTKFVVSHFESSKYFSIYPDQTLHTNFSVDEIPSQSKQLEWNDLEQKQKNHISLVLSAIDSMQQSPLKKVVLATTLECNGLSKSPIDYFKTILSQYKNTFNYLLFHPKYGLWMGATPERLITMQQSHLTTMALAGTRPLGSSSWGEKEKEEQGFVVNEILNTLRKYASNASIHHPDAKTIRAGQLEHLQTTITAELTISPVEAANALHPTPAVGGVPKEMALDFIKTHEQLDRSLYAGFLGVIDQDKTDLYVNLRCMTIQDDNAMVYVGGGITEKSNPQDEWQEVLEKANTMGRILMS